MNLLKTSYSQNIVYGQRGDSFIRYTILKKQYPLEFEVKIGKENLGKFSLNLIGEYNIENALPSIYYLYKNNMDIEQIKDIISSFKGVVRRQQVLFDSKHIIYIDDFAHHPTAIKQTLESIKNSFPEKKILTVFEPASWSLAIAK